MPDVLVVLFIVIIATILGGKVSRNSGSMWRNRQPGGTRLMSSGEKLGGICILILLGYFIIKGLSR